MGLRGLNLKDEFFFQPGLERTYEYAFSTNAGFTQDYELYVRMLDGSTTDLTPYVTINTYYVKDVSSGSIEPFTAYLKLPDKIDVPGIHEIRVGARETQNIGGGNMGVRTASEARIIIVALHPSDYAETGFSAPNANINDSMNFIFTIRNLGEPDLLTKGRVDILEPETDLLLGVARTDETVVKSTQRGELVAHFNNTGLRPGPYLVHAVLNWGKQNTTEWNATINIGTKSIKVTDHTKEFVKDALNKMQITILSGWNSKMRNVNAEVQVIKDDQTFTTFKTISQDIDPWSAATLEGYLNTSGLDYGNYPIKIITRFEDYSSTHESTIEIKEGALTPVLEEEPQEKTQLNIPTYMIVLIIIVSTLFLIFIILLILIMRRR
ncbi:MAG: hypothetical protein ABIJ21_01145 [Nanoarchaeota archaeon]